MALAMNDLVVRLGATTAPFDKKMKGSQKTVGRLRTAVGGLSSRLMGMSGIMGMLSVGAMTVMIKKNLDLLDSVGKMSDRLGIATEKLMGLRHAAELTGAGAETLEAGLTTMSKRLGEAARGAGAATPALKHIGLAIGDIIALSPDQQFIAIAEAISKLKTHTERAAAAANIFSKGNMNLINLLAEGREGIEAMQREAERLGITFDREMARKAELANDAMTRLGATIKGTATTIVSDLSPVIEKLATDLSEVLPAAAAKTGSAFLQMQRFVTQGIGGLVLLSRKHFQLLGQQSNFLDNMVGEIQKQLKEIDDALSGKLPPSAQKKGGMPGIGGDGAAAEQLTRAKAIIASMETPIEKYNRQVTELVRLMTAGAFGENIQVFQRALNSYQSELIKVTQKANPAREALGSLREEVFRLTSGLDAGQIALREFSQTPGVTTLMIDKFIRLQEKLKALQKTKGLQEAGKRLTEQMRTPAQRYREELAHIEKLRNLKVGGISEETAERARKAAKQQLLGSGAVGPKSTGAKEIKSREALTAILRATRGGGKQDPMKQIAKSNEKIAQDGEQTKIAVQTIADRPIEGFAGGPPRGIE